jgi:hypothetical protein
LAGVAVSAAEVKNAIIGKKVSGVMSVSIDGKELSKEAVIIDGVSYLPVRDAAEALGSEVAGVKDRHITIESKEAKGGASMPDGMTEETRAAQIEGLTEGIAYAELRIKILEDYMAEHPDSDNAHLVADAEVWKAKIAELEAKIAELTAAQ